MSVIDYESNITEAPTGSGKSAYPAVLSLSDVVTRRNDDISAWSPGDFGLPFSRWRERQLDTALSIRDTLSQPARGERTVVLTRTKSLQIAYATFGAEVLFGRANYDCTHVDGIGRKCDRCLFAEQGMHKCPVSQDCPYLAAKNRALYTHFACVNYAYWLVAQRFRDSKVAYLVCDEAHLLDDITLGASGITINDKVRREYHLPDFPRIKKSTQDGTSSFADQQIAHTWLDLARETLVNLWKQYDNRAQKGDQLAADKARKIENLGMRVANAKRALEAVQMAWYIRAGPGLAYYHGRPLPAILIKPLTSRYHFKRLFYGDWKVSMMSATIGNFDTFANNLGIKTPQTIRVSNVWTPETRPIHLLKSPAMNYKTSEAGKREQARAIIRAIRKCPSEWSGIVLVTKKTTARDLARRLSEQLDLSDRVWVTPEQDRNGRYLGTQDQVALWHERRSQVTNSILIAWQFWEGYDGLDERILIVAKVPYPFLGDEYERARQEFDHRMYGQRTAWQLVQAWGRTRRGRPEDYDGSDEIRGFVAIADMNVTRVLGYMPLDVLRALQCRDKTVMQKIARKIRDIEKKEASKRRAKNAKNT